MRLGAVLAIVCIALSACGDRGPAPEPAGEYEISRDFTRGPVTLTVAVSKSEITIADRIDLVLEVKAGEGYSVELPSFGDKLQQFGIVDYNTPRPMLGDNGVTITRRIYELEPFLSGEYKIPPMRVSFFGQGDTLKHFVESDTIPVIVHSILPEDMAELELKDIAGPVSFPSNPYPLALIAVAAAAAVAVALLVWRRRKRRSEKEPVIPPHEIAFARLEKLLSSGMLDDRRFREFTSEVADILRYYIEDRFGLMAPERTTEEFLAEAGTGLQVDRRRKEILREFLIHCDLVKFAALEPSEEDVKGTFETCRDFIEATKREEVSGKAA